MIKSNDMTENIDSDTIRKKLIIKAVRNIRKAGEKEDAEKGMYRPEIKLDLQRSLLLTESYRETEGEPMVLRRAKALERILTGTDLHIQDWERIVGNNVSTPQGLYFGIDMNWRSVRRIVEQDEGRTLLDAQKNPEEHSDLLVRVAGYSAYFVDLSKGLQDSIIARTGQRL